MSDAAHVSRVKTALALLREPPGRIVGMAVATELEGRSLLVTTSRLALRLTAGELELVRHGQAEVLDVDEEAGIALLEPPEAAGLSPYPALALAPASDGEAVLLTGAGLTVSIGQGQQRHLWITRGGRLAGRLHVFHEGQREEEFRYLLDLPAGALPPGSPVVRSVDGALLGLLCEQDAPAEGLSLAVPLRDAASLAQGLSG